jgi:hypothetical protein
MEKADDATKGREDGTALDTASRAKYMPGIYDQCDHEISIDTRFVGSRRGRVSK